MSISIQNNKGNYETVLSGMDRIKNALGSLKIFKNFFLDTKAKVETLNTAIRQSNAYEMDTATKDNYFSLINAHCEDIVQKRGELGNPTVQVKKMTAEYAKNNKIKLKDDKPVLESKSIDTSALKDAAYDPTSLEGRT